MPWSGIREKGSSWVGWSAHRRCRGWPSGRVHGAEERPCGNRHARQRRWRMRRNRDRDPLGDLPRAATIWRVREPLEEPPLDDGRGPATQRAPAPSGGGTDDAPRTRAAADVCLGQSGHPEQRQRPCHRAQRVEPPGGGLPRHHRHHRPAGLATITANGENHDRRRRAGTGRSAELPFAHPMPVQPAGQSWRARGAAAPRALPRPDRVHRRRRLHPPLDVQLASDDRSVGSAIAHDRAAVAGALDRRGAPTSLRSPISVPSPSSTRDRAEALSPSRTSPQLARQRRPALPPGPGHRHRAGSRSASPAPSGTPANTR